MIITYKILNCVVTGGDRIVIVTGDKANEYQKIISTVLGFDITEESKGYIGNLGIELLKVEQ